MDMKITEFFEISMLQTFLDISSSKINGGNSISNMQSANTNSNYQKKKKGFRLDFVPACFMFIPKGITQSN